MSKCNVTSQVVQNQKVIIHVCAHIGVPEQALGWFPLGLGLVVEDEPSELS